MKFTLALAVVALIAGCTGGTPQERAGSGGSARVMPEAPAADACGAARLQHLVGSPLPQPFSHDGDVRIYTSGSPVTMDHRPDRLNIELASGGAPRVVAVSCG